MTRARANSLGVACLIAALAASPALAVDGTSKDPRAIMNAVAADRPGADRTLSRLKMTIRDGAGTRERSLEMRSKRYPEARKSLIFLAHPPDVRNTGFLSVDYHAKGRPDETWLYLPKLRRASRVASSGHSDAFVGSDFTLSDMSRRDPDDYEYTLLEQSVQAGGDDCWLIESIPRSEAVRSETGYEKTQSWISKSKQTVMQFKAWPLDKSKTKYLKASDFRQIDGIWTAHRLEMRTVQGGKMASETIVQVESVKNRADEIQDTDFTLQRLEGGV